MTAAAGRTVDRWVAIGLGLAFFGLYNANGREIPSGDSQPAKFAAVMLVRHHVLTLDGVVGRVPLYADRVAFQPDRDGHWRNGCPLPPVIEAAGVAAALSGLGIIQLEAPLAPATVAKITASFFAALAGVLAFLTARRFCGPGAAAGVAGGFALGTGIWPLASQTLWQHASLLWSAMAAIWLWTRKDGPHGVLQYGGLGLLLGWSASARPQTLPLVGVLALGILLRASPKERAACLIGVATPLLVCAGLNLKWFGHVLGAAPAIERTSLSTHNMRRMWEWPWSRIGGLLLSPSRGLLVFSPIVLVALAARPTPEQRPVLHWTVAAALAQLLLYASYGVWWGGFTYGPRYMLDLLPAMVPAAALGAARIARGGALPRAAALAALAWSIGVSATGAFCYPNDQWNNDPESIDRAHERLWDVRDSQIPRCWSRGLSPQNFALFDRTAWRKD